MNVFLGTSGDHGQLSPAASYPFSMLSIGPVTYPSTHTGYEYLAKEFLGFTHNRFEGVGCRGSGGNLLIKPFLGKNSPELKLVKSSEAASPGFYEVKFTNGIQASFSVVDKFGVHRYRFPVGEKGFYIDLSHVLGNRFYTEEHAVVGNSLSGFIESGTTCNAGKYKLFYYLEFNSDVKFEDQEGHKLIVHLPTGLTEIEIRVGFSSVSVEYAKKSISKESFSNVKGKSAEGWNNALSRITVSGDKERAKLFYSLFYRALQSPYLVSEKDGVYRANDGSLQQSDKHMYNGWAIWDNYKTQLPLLSFAYSDRYKDIAYSIANLYKYGKKDFATENEASNTVRTEHAVVVLLDAMRKGYDLPMAEIVELVKKEVDQLSYSSPDKALESSYDAWALAEIFAELKQTELSEKYRQKALEYKKYWQKDFQDLTKNDLDAMSARKMYQGTVWQYRWSVPFDIKNLKELSGGEIAFISQLDEFFNKDYYSHANEPDIHAPYLYNATVQPWKSQMLIRRLAKDTVVQHYFNDNSRGVGSYVGPIYRNHPQALLRTMDDDAGAMSSWYVLAASGLSPACVGSPIYYLHLPLFKSVRIQLSENKVFNINIRNFSESHNYIEKVLLNGTPLNRNWLTHDEIMQGGTLEITSGSKPNFKWGIENQWVSEIKP